MCLDECLVIDVHLCLQEISNLISVLPEHQDESSVSFSHLGQVQMKKKRGCGLPRPPLSPSGFSPGTVGAPRCTGARGKGCTWLFLLSLCYLVFSLGSVHCLGYLEGAAVTWHGSRLLKYYLTESM